MAMKRYSSVAAYLKALTTWQAEVTKLREIINSTELIETVKWGVPCYVHKEKNVVGLAAYNNYFGMWFHQGVFLKDESNVLINAQEEKTKALRQWRFESIKDIKVRLIKSYLKEAIQLVEDGKEVKPERGKAVVMPKELTNALAMNKKAKACFDKLTPGKQREFADHISEAKRSETKVKRLAKILPMIEHCVGLHDKYRNC